MRGRFINWYRFSVAIINPLRQLSTFSAKVNPCVLQRFIRCHATVQKENTILPFSLIRTYLLYQGFEVEISRKNVEIVKWPESVINQDINGANSCISTFMLHISFLTSIYPSPFKHPSPPFNFSFTSLQ